MSSMACFFLVLVISSVLGVSSVNWFSIWVAMETSTFFFIPILLNSWSVEKSLISLKYFLIQSIGSLFFLLSSLLLESSPSMGELLMLFSVMIKLGMYPFHGWMFQICENLSMDKFLLLVTIQEIVPLVVVSKSHLIKEGSILSLMMGSFAVLMIFGHISVSWMLMTSSLFNTSWLVLGALLGNEALMLYFLIYFSLVIGFFLAIFKTSLFNLSNLSLDLSKQGKLLCGVFVFFFMGLPPFGVFLSKTEVLEEIIASGGSFFGGLLLFLSSLMIFMYTKMVFSVMVSEGMNLKVKKWLFFSLFMSIIGILPWSF